MDGGDYGTVWDKPPPVVWDTDMMAGDGNGDRDGGIDSAGGAAGYTYAGNEDPYAYRYGDGGIDSTGGAAGYTDAGNKDPYADRYGDGEIDSAGGAAGYTDAGNDSPEVMQGINIMNGGTVQDINVYNI